MSNKLERFSKRFKFEQYSIYGLGSFEYTLLYTLVPQCLHLFIM